MKYTVLTLALALCLTLLPLCGCERGEAPAPQPGEYAVCFVRKAEEGDHLVYGYTLDYEYRTLPPGRRRVDGLMDLVLGAPLSEGLARTVPPGVTVRSWRVEEGVIYLDLSEGYGGLSGTALTQADYAITLTLCSGVRDIEAVAISVEGEYNPLRSHQILRPDDLMPPEEGQPQAHSDD